MVLLGGGVRRQQLRSLEQSWRPGSGTVDDSGRHWPGTVAWPGSRGGAVVASRVSLGPPSVRSTAASGASSCPPWLLG